MGARRVAVRLAMGLVVACNGVAAAQEFGRWESPVDDCLMLLTRQGRQLPEQASCLRIRVDQTIEGMLRVRFIAGLSGGRHATEELSFAGLLLRQDQPLRCSAGKCQPGWPLRLQVHGITVRRFDGRGLASQLPYNRLARGSCRLEVNLLECQALSESGESWQATAMHRSSPADHSNPGNP